jgi:type I restriction enzyme, S subunit
VKPGWTSAPFEEVVEDCSAGSAKTLQSNYLPSGRFAVVDQGQQLIAGYVNDAELLCHVESPAVIFGDHTRIFKFVDFPFCLGADGVKVLRPKTRAADGKYLYHYLLAQQIPEAGYSRHFKYLKRLNVVLPPIDEQRRIAAILDQAEALRAKRRQALAKLDTLTQSLFLEMFGDPLRNTQGLTLRRVDSICRIVRGSSPRPQGDPRYYGGPIPRLMVADLTRDGWFVTPRIDSLTEMGAELSRPVPAGTVVMAVSGNVGLVSILKVNACIHDGFVGFTYLNETVVEPRYLVTLLHLLKVTHEQRKAGAIFQNLTTTDIKAMRIPVPALELQRSFVAQLGALDKTASYIKHSRDRLIHLSSSLQSGAFRGEL